MRSNRGIFWYSLGLTLLLLLPMVLTVAFFTDQYQKQQLLRQASAADSTLHIEPGAQGVYTLLLVVQQEEPAFVLARADGPQQTVTLCALPGSLRVSAPSGTTTLAECALSAGAGRAAQLLVGTVATGETAAPALHYIAATPATWADCAGRTASARIDTASLLDAAARTRLGYGEDPIAVCTAAQASELIAQLQAALPGAGEGCMARAAVWAAFLRQDPALLAGLPDGLRSRSARLLTDLLAAYGADACQDLVLLPFKTNREDSDLTTEEYNLTGLLDYPILANAGCFAIQDTGDAAALKSAESAVLWLYSSGDGEKALTDTLGVITPWNTASDTTTLGAMQVKQVNTAILPGIDLPTAAAAQALTANEEALQGGTRGKAERTAFTQAALAALGAE